MDGTVAVVIAIVAIVITVNVAAICAGLAHNKPIHYLALTLGGLGLFSLVGLVASYIDAFTQIWIKRPGYEGQLVFFFIYSTIATTVGSLLMTVVVVVHALRSEA